MTPALQTFLTELYAIDPSLRDDEELLIPLIDTLLKNDPSLPADPQFVTRLRHQLQTRAKKLSTPNPNPMHKLLYIFSGALTAAIILPLVYLSVSKNSQQISPSDSPLFGFHVEQGKDREFGSLNTVNALDQSAPRPQSGGGGGTVSAVEPAVLGTREAMSATYGDHDAKMIAPPDWQPTQIQYIFDEDLPPLSPQVSVHKRTLKPLSVAFSQIAGSFNVGSVNLNSFDGATLDSFTVAQNVPYGYSIMVNMREGSISINAQWDQWPMSKCQTESCYAAQRVKIGDVPSDAEALRIAKAFVEDHGIDLTAYGEPEVDSSWKREYERTTDKSIAFIPDTVRVVFPLMIDGKPVYDQSGMKAGLSVGVHAKEKKVFDVWGIMDRSYRASDYEGVTDVRKIKDFLARVDSFPMPVDVKPLREGSNGSTSSAPKIVMVSLGKPTLSFATFYRYENGTSDELLVPSLIFPVQTPKDAAFFFRQTVVVPLAKEMLDQQNPPVQIMEGVLR